MLFVFHFFVLSIGLLNCKPLTKTHTLLNSSISALRCGYSFLKFSIKMSTCFPVLNFLILRDFVLQILSILRAKLLLEVPLFVEQQALFFLSDFFGYTLVKI